MPDSPPPRAAGAVPAPVAGGHTAGAEFDRLVEIMRTLRSPEGCPWDREQTMRSLAPYVIEEAAEVVDAIEHGTPADVCEEVGDLLFEGVFLAQVAADAGTFTAADAVRTVAEKLIRRHPHVFVQPAPAGASEGAIDTPAQVKDQWDQIKAGEQAARTGDGPPPRVLDRVPRSLPALAASHAIGRAVAAVRFDWPGPDGALDKVEEEIREVRAELASGDTPEARARLFEEFGDLLFALAQLARKLDLDPEAALRSANAKFRGRFDALEDGVRADGLALGALDLEALEARWQQVKRA